MAKRSKGKARSAKTGRYVTRKEAEQSPDTTVVEREPKRKKRRATRCRP